MTHVGRQWTFLPLRYGFVVVRRRVFVQFFSIFSVFVLALAFTLGLRRSLSFAAASLTLASIITVISRAFVVGVRDASLKTSTNACMRVSIGQVTI